MYTHACLLHARFMLSTIAHQKRTLGKVFSAKQAKMLEHLKRGPGNINGTFKRLRTFSRRLNCFFQPVKGWSDTAIMYLCSRTQTQPALNYRLSIFRMAAGSTSSVSSLYNEFQFNVGILFRSCTVVELQLETLPKRRN